MSCEHFPRLARLAALIICTAATLLSCSGGAGSATVPTARYSVQQFVEGRQDPVLTIEGRGDFRRAVMVDESRLGDRPFVERLTIKNVTYTRRTNEDQWERGVDTATPEAKSLVAVRNALFDSARSIGYLRSVAIQVGSDGTDEVRGDRTTRYRAVVDLGRVEGPPGYEVPMDVWVDDHGPTR